MDTKKDSLIGAESELNMPDTEAGLEPELAVEAPMVDEETQMQIEFQQAIENAAEDRAQTPFQVAAMTHARYCQPFMQSIDAISGGAAKRILKYLVGHPFYVAELNAQNKEVEGLAEVANKLCNTKYTMALCVAIEREARISRAIQEQEDLIQPLPEDITKKEE